MLFFQNQLITIPVYSPNQEILASSSRLDIMWQFASSTAFQTHFYGREDWTQPVLACFGANLSVFQIIFEQTKP